MEAKEKKMKKDSGKTYQTYKGDQRDKKRLDHLLCCHCNFCCPSKLSRSERERVFVIFIILEAITAKTNTCIG